MELEKVVNLSAQQLRKAAEIKERIEKLQRDLWRMISILAKEGETPKELPTKKEVEPEKEDFKKNSRKNRKRRFSMPHGWRKRLAARRKARLKAKARKRPVRKKTSA